MAVKEFSDINVSVKYCGGCNPNFDRKLLVNMIEVYFNIKISAYDETNLPDILLIISGCKSECIDIDKYKGTKDTIKINSTSQLENVIDRIKENYLVQRGKDYDDKR